MNYHLERILFYEGFVRDRTYFTTILGGVFMVLNNFWNPKANGKYWKIYLVFVSLKSNGTEMGGNAVPHGSGGLNGRSLPHSVEL